MKKTYLLLLIVFFVPFVSATINDNGLTYSTGGNQFTSGFNITMATDLINIVNITKISSETATNAYLIYPNGTIIDSGVWVGNTFTLSTPFETNIGDKLLVACGVVGSAGNEVHSYNVATSFPISGGSTPHINWTGSVYKIGANPWTPQTTSWCVDSIGTAVRSVSSPYASVQVNDLYDNATLSGLTVYIGTDSNTTDGSGVATIYNPTGLNYSVDGGSNYFNTSGTATENATTQAYIYGAFVSVQANNILDVSVSNFSLIPDQTAWTNYTDTGVNYLYLKPNAQNNVSIYVYDGNYTYNNSQQTYRNLTWLLNTTGQDTSNYNISGLYQALLNVNVSLGTTETYISNHTTNVSGDINYSEFTDNYSISYPVMWSNYSLVTDPTGYSLSYKNISIGAYNYTYSVTIPAYALNSFYINILDEITTNAITETMIIELISEATAGSYSTSNGSIAFEILTPADYTIRYRSNGTNYTERDYYQTLVNQNYYDLTLYGIRLDESDLLIVTVVNTAGQGIEGATVQLRRYFVDSNAYEVVEMAVTSYNGEAVFSMQPETGHYKLAVTYNGRTWLATSPENYAPSGTTHERTVTFNVGDAYYDSYVNLPNVDRTLTYNNNTETLSFSWNDPNGIVNEGCIYAEYPNSTRWSVLSSCQNGSAGNVLLTLTNTQNITYRYYANLETNTNFSLYTVFSGWVESTNKYSFGVAGYVFGVLIIGTLAIGGSFIGAIGVVLTTVAGVIFAVALNLLPLGWSFVTALVAFTVGIAIYFMRK